MFPSLIDRAKIDRVVPGRIRETGQTASVQRARQHVSCRSGWRVGAACSLESRVSTGMRGASGIADIANEIGECELLGLDHDVQRSRAVESPLPQRKLLHDVEHHERSDSGAVRWNLLDCPSAIRRADRVYPFRLVAFEVLGRRASRPVRPRASEDGLRCWSAIETIAPGLRDSSRAMGKIGITKDFACCEAGARR